MAIPGRLARDPSHYRLSLVLAAIAVLGFAPTYWLLMARGTLQATLLHHIHGAAIFGWYGLQLWQARLVATGRTSLHREIGLAGIALGTLVVALGVTMAVVALRRRLVALGAGPAAEIFLINLSDIGLFAGLFTAAMATTRRPAVHRRLVTAASIAMLDVAVFRWVDPLHLSPPFGDWLSALLPDLMLLALIVHDRRTLGRVHPATLAATAVILVVHLTAPLLSPLPLALPIAAAFAAIPG